MLAKSVSSFQNFSPYLDAGHAITIHSLSMGTWKRFNSPTASLQFHAMAQEFGWYVREFTTGYEFMMVIPHDSVVSSGFQPSSDSPNLTVGKIELAQVPRFFIRLVERPTQSVPWKPHEDWTPDEQATRNPRHTFKGPLHSVKGIVDLISSKPLHGTRDPTVFQRPRQTQGAWEEGSSSLAQSSSSTREHSSRRAEPFGGSSTSASQSSMQGSSRVFTTTSQSSAAPLSFPPQLAQPYANLWIQADPRYQPLPPHPQNTSSIPSTSTIALGGGYVSPSNLHYGSPARQHHHPLAPSSTMSQLHQGAAPPQHPGPLFRGPDGSPYSYTAEQRISGQSPGSRQHSWPMMDTPWAVGSRSLPPPGPHSIDGGSVTLSAPLQSPPSSGSFTGTFPPNP